MPQLHLLKLCVGAENVGDLEAWVAIRVSSNEKAGLGRVHDHVTRMFPKRRAELIGGGSIYWVIKGAVLVRQPIIDLEARPGDDGVARCAILLDRRLIPTQAQPRRAFQGWRYLREDEAPRDASEKEAASAPSLRAELAALGLL